MIECFRKLESALKSIVGIRRFPRLRTYQKRSLLSDNHKCWIRCSLSSKLSRLCLKYRGLENSYLITTLRACHTQSSGKHSVKFIKKFVVKWMITGLKRIWKSTWKVWYLRSNLRLKDSHKLLYWWNISNHFSNFRMRNLPLLSFQIHLKICWRRKQVLDSYNRPITHRRTLGSNRCAPLLNTRQTSSHRTFTQLRIWKRLKKRNNWSLCWLSEALWQGNGHWLK